MDEKFWFLKRCDLFERLSPEQIARLESRSRSRTFGRNSLVYVPADQGDSVLLLVSGRVKLYHLTSEGKQTVLAFIDPGELFGELTLFDPGRREEFAETMEPSTVVLIPGEEIRRLMDEHADVSFAVTKLMGLRRRRIERRLKALLFHSNRDRLVHLLLELAGQYGRRTPEGVLIDIKLSHQDLSSVIGSTRESVTVLLGELQSEGVLEVRRRQILLKRIDRLAAGIDQPTPELPADAPSTRPALRGSPLES